MEIRTMRPADLDGVLDIDSTVESASYLHVERQVAGMSASWRIEPRPLHERRVHRRALSDEQAFAMKQIALGADEGLALVAEHEGALAAAIAAKPDLVNRVLRVIDLRVDFDHRRQGLATALMFQAIQQAREQELRAVSVEAEADNAAAAELLVKLGFEPTGLDTHLHSNHDLVKENVVVFWYHEVE